jgi:hypothetical protein
MGRELFVGNSDGILVRVAVGLEVVGVVVAE